MTHRERVVAALSHQTPDRVPVDLGATRVSSLSVAAYTRLKAHFGLDRPTRIIDRVMQTAAVDEEVLVALDVDTRGIFPGPPDAPRDLELPDGRWLDEWGVTRRLSPDGYYYDLEVSPLAGDISSSDLEGYDWPEATDPGRVRGVAEEARRLRDATDYAIVAHAPGGWIHIAQYLRGFEDWYTDMAARPGLAADLMSRVRNVTLEMARPFLEAVGPYIDVVATGDDIGAQLGLQVSPKTYREYIKPLQEVQFREFRALTDAPIFYHTCGDVYPILQDLVDIGVGILNPVQVSAAEMGDTARLKREFGDRLCFWGGVDTTQVLPLGTEADVVAEVERRVRDLGAGGGYVLGPVHNVQPDVPVRNLLAAYEHARKVEL